MSQVDKSLGNRRFDKFIGFFEKEIPMIKEARRNKKYLVILILSLIIIISYPIIGTLFFVQIFEPLINIFSLNFGVLAVGMFFGVFLICLTFFGLIAMSKITLGGISAAKPKWTAFFIYSLTITIFLSGSVFIHSVVGSPNIDWKLHNNGDYVSDITCSDVQENLIYGHLISCKIKNPKIDLENIKGEIILTLYDGTEIIEAYPNFTAPLGLGHVSLNLTALHQNESISLDTGFYPKFYDVEGEREREKDFLTYFFGLLFISIITIPQLVIKIFEGLRKEKL